MAAAATILDRKRVSAYQGGVVASFLIRRMRQGIARLLPVLVLVLGLTGASVGMADDKQPLPIPRFVSMKHGTVNVRVGPGRKYPILWVFTRRDMPVEIIQEFDTYRKIRDWEGTEGWVAQVEVTGKRTIIVTGEIRALRRAADPEASPIAKVEPGVIGKLIECPAASMDWCRVEINDLRGWMRRTEIWGVYPKEIYPR